MKDVITPVAHDTYAAADYLEFQARARGVRPASAASNAFSGAQAKGEDAVVYCENVGSLTHHAAPLELDANHDWRDRILRVRGCRLSQFQKPGAASDSEEYAGYQQFEGIGYTGTGGLDATGAAPSAGNPPDEGPVNAGAATSYRVPLEALGAYLYADATDGHLYLYNAEGVSLRLLLFVTGTSDLGGH